MNTSPSLSCGSATSWVLLIAFLCSAACAASPEVTEQIDQGMSLTVLLHVVHTNVSNLGTEGDAWHSENFEAIIELRTVPPKIIWLHERERITITDYGQLSAELTQFLARPDKELFVSIVARPEVSFGQLHSVLRIVLDSADQVQRQVTIETHTMIVDGFLESNEPA